MLEKSHKGQRQQAESEIETFRQKVIQGRKERKAKRTSCITRYSTLEYQALLTDLAKQSVAEKNELKRLKAQWQD